MENKILQKYFHKQNICITPLTELRNYTVSLLPEESRLIYQQELISRYYDNLTETSVDHSFVIILKTSEKFIYLASAVVYECNSIVCGGDPEGPITLYFNDDLYEDQKAKLTELVLNKYSNIFSSKEIYISLHPFSESLIKPFKKYFELESALLVPLAGRYIYLDSTYAQTRLNYRKSIKPLINKTLRKFSFKVSHNIDSHELLPLFEEYKNLHLVVSGRLTRPEESWLSQKTMLTSGVAFMLVIYDNLTPIGAAFFVSEGKVLHYWSGAYNREYTTMGLSHLAVDYAINWSYKNNMRFFNFGPPQIIQDNIISEKQKKLSHFRQAFSSSMSIGSNIRISIK